MKKVLAVILITIMVVSASFCAFAAPNGFVSSVSGNPAPEIVDSENGSEDCTAVLVITPYADRHDLSDTLRLLIEQAYKDIVNSNKITDLNAELEQFLRDKDIDPSDVAVSDLFDIRYTDCDIHEGHLKFDITLKSDTLKNFVALLHKNHDGKWEIVKDAKLTHGGTHLEFSIDNLSPFAIVVDPTGTNNPPATNDNAKIYLYASLMLASAIGLVIVLVKSKKQEA